MFPWISNSTCSAASPCTRLSRAPSIISGSDFHRRVYLPQDLTIRSIYSIRNNWTKAAVDLPVALTLPFLPIRALRPRRILQRPSPLRSPTVAFQVFDPVGLRMCHEAQSLHLRYGLGIALSTLSPYRYLHEPKTRFLVEWLAPLARTGVSPAGSARLSLAHRIGRVCQRPKCSSPSASEARTTAHPVHHAGRAPGESRMRKRENPLPISG